MHCVHRYQKNLDPLHHDLHMRHGMQMVRHGLLQALYALLHVPGGRDVLTHVLSDADLPRRGVLRIEVGECLACLRQSAWDIQALLTEAVIAMQRLTSAHLREMSTGGKR